MPILSRQRLALLLWGPAWRLHLSSLRSSMSRDPPPPEPSEAVGLVSPLPVDTSEAVGSPEDSIVVPVSFGEKHPTKTEEVSTSPRSLASMDAGLSQRQPHVETLPARGQVESLFPRAQTPAKKRARLKDALSFLALARDYSQNEATTLPSRSTVGSTQVSPSAQPSAMPSTLRH